MVAFAMRAWHFHMKKMSHDMGFPLISNASDRPAHTRSLTRAFASRVNIHLKFLSLKETAQARLSLHLSKCHIVENHMSWLKCIND